MCPICGKMIQNVSTHLSRVHKIDGPERTMLLRQEKQAQQPFQTDFNSPQLFHSDLAGKRSRCEPFRLHHPFTCMVSGMTGCGKTTWVQRLLQHKAVTITPTPQRIVWCYSRWQPAYMEMIETVPEIEFVKGIPSSIEKDHYFDVNVRNLIVIDDQMTTASNDKHIINLFTQGSHHRNLSVIYLVQNLFHQSKGNRDISLNCHYLVIFKNPRDQLQVLTLAKQMYPRQTEYFLQKYQEAVSRPFGYLFIDLKTTTPDDCRLRTNVLPGEQTEDSSEDKVSKELVKYLKQQSLLMPPTVPIFQNLQDQMAGVLNNSTLNTDQKARQYVQLQNNFLQFKKKLNSSLLSSPTSEPTAVSNTDTPAEQTTPLSNTNAFSQSEITTPSILSDQSPTAQTPVGALGLLTPPPSASSRKERKRPRYDLIKNYMDDDAQKVVGPYLKADRIRVRRSMRVAKKRTQPY